MAILNLNISEMKENEMSGIPADSEYYDKESNTLYKVVNIKYEDIDPSENNNASRSLVYDDIRVLADSIRDYGLKDPIRVYKGKQVAGKADSSQKDEIPKYIILSGHRRYDAFRILNEEDKLGIKYIPCIICKEPADKIEEYIDIAQSNISRRKPKDLIIEIQAANGIWNDICEDNDRKNQYLKKLEDTFDKRYAKHEKYIEDPNGFKRNHYRPRLEFIRSVTGLDVSNATIKSYLTKTIESIPEEGNDYKAPSKYNTDLTVKKLKHKFSLLKNSVSKLYNESDPELCDEITKELEQLIEKLK